MHYCVCAGRFHATVTVLPILEQDVRRQIDRINSSVISFKKMLVDMKPGPASEFQHAHSVR